MLPENAWTGRAEVRQVEPAKFEKAVFGWLARYVSEAAPSLLRAQIAVAALRELRGGNEAAEKVLTELVPGGVRRQ